MNSLLNLDVHSSVLSTPLHQMNWINSLESKWLKIFSEQISYEWSVRIGNLTILITTLIFSIFLFFLFLTALLYKEDIYYSIRFSDKLDGLSYIWVDQNGYKELIFKKPKNFFEKVEFIVSIYYVRFQGESVPVRESHIKITAIITMIIFFLVSISIVISLLFIYNLVA